MNEELQKALAEIINGALSSAAAAKDFVLAELPDVVQQLLLWKAVESGLFFVFWLASLLLLLWVIKRKSSIITGNLDDGERQRLNHLLAIGYARRTVGEDIEYDSLRRRGNPIIGIICGLGLSVCLIGLSCSLAWLKIWLAPKVYLLEYAASLVK